MKKIAKQDKELGGHWEEEEYEEIVEVPAGGKKPK